LPWQPSTQALAIEARRREPSCSSGRNRKKINHITVSVSLVLSVFKGEEGRGKRERAEQGGSQGKKRGPGNRLGLLGEDAKRNEGYEGEYNISKRFEKQTKNMGMELIKSSWRKSQSKLLQDE
jgi:hypothetical protein